MPTFDEAGQRVTVSHPIYETEDDPQDAPRAKLTLKDTFDLLLCGAMDDREIAGRVKVMGYIVKAERAPRTLDELGFALGISKQAAHKRLTIFRNKCREILTSGPGLVDGPPICDE